MNTNYFGNIDHETSSPRATDSMTSRFSRFSRFFGRRSEQSSAPKHSQRSSGVCEVPIFMSPTPARISVSQEQPLSPELQQTSGLYSGQFTSSVARPTAISASSVYSASPGIQQHQARFMEQIEDHSLEPPASRHDLEEGDSSAILGSSEIYIVRDKRRRRRRVSESTRQKIAGKKRLSAAFGVTFLAAVSTYLVLAFTGTASGIIFHVISVLFVLALAGVFLHSTIRLVMLQKRKRVRQHCHQDWHGTQSRSTGSASSRSCLDPFADPVPEKPIEILEGGNTTVTATPRGRNKKVVVQPPPVYGNFRESKRMKPEMVFWSKQNPSPTTPTYEEAMKDVQTAVGYQPPQYTSPKRERELPNGVRASNVHPLERERLVGLIGNTMSSQT